MQLIEVLVALEEMGLMRVVPDGDENSLGRFLANDVFVWSDDSGKTVINVCGLITMLRINERFADAANVRVVDALVA